MTKVNPEIRRFEENDVLKGNHDVAAFSCRTFVVNHTKRIHDFDQDACPFQNILTFRETVSSRMMSPTLIKSILDYPFTDTD